MYYKSGKPFAKNLKKAMAAMGTDKTNTAMLGDQLLTDAAAGKHIGLRTIIVPPIRDKNNAFFRSKRAMEVGHIKKYVKLRGGTLACQPSTFAVRQSSKNGFRIIRKPRAAYCTEFRLRQNFAKLTPEKREKVNDLLSFLTKSADGGINPLSWMKSLRDEILLRKVNGRRI